MTVLETRQNATEIEKQSKAISVKKVLYATDFSATSESALPYATAISRRFGSTLPIPHRRYPNCATSTFRNFSVCGSATE
jgi:hypothetical protein